MNGYGVICKDKQGTFLVDEDLSWADAIARAAKISPSKKPAIFVTVVDFKGAADQRACPHEPTIGPGKTCCRTCGLVLPLPVTKS